MKEVQKLLNVWLIKKRVANTNTGDNESYAVRVHPHNLHLLTTPNQIRYHDYKFHTFVKKE